VRKSPNLKRLSVALATGAVLAALPLAGAQTPPYLDAKLPVEERVKDLLGRMTLEEKVGQMTQMNIQRLMGQSEWDRGPINANWQRIAFEEAKVGSLLAGGDAAPVPNTAESWAKFTNALQKYNLEHSRLKIPFVFGFDAVHGNSKLAGATIFPHNIGMAATGDEALVEALGASTAKSVRAIGVQWTFAPVADVGRDPRWGRYYETWGEDTTLSSEMVAASVRGLQGKSLTTGVAASVKHFLGYGEPNSGMDRHDALLPLRTIRELHLPPYAAGLEAGAATVMVNSGSVNGVPVHASKYLLTDVLRKQLAFEGLAVSDWADIQRLIDTHKIAATLAEATEKSINAGVDMYMVPHDVQSFTRTLTDLVKQGKVSEARINEAAGRALGLKFKLGLFERPYADEAKAKAAENADRALARRAAIESLTLLSNSGVLPLPANTKTVLLAGPAADDVAMQMGGWTINWQNVGNNQSEQPQAVTVYEGIRSALPKDARLNYVAGANVAAAKAAAKGNAAAIVVIGEQPYAEGRGDSTSLALPEAQELLVQEIASTGVPVVTVIMAGRPVVLQEATIRASKAILMAYLPGTEGGNAVADVLFGKVSPSGRLPFSWPRSVGQVPLAYNHLPFDRPDPADRNSPRYPFGHGLSYTSFSYDALQASASGNVVKASIKVTNSGKVAGDNVVQLFASRRTAFPMAPVTQLVSFARVSLKSGESKTVSLDFPSKRLAVVPGDVTGSEPMLVQAGEYALRVANTTSAVTLGQASVDGK
jgi:beta-glucosidase